jgi:hypothetical protein
MHQGDRHTALTDGCCDALHRAGTDIADGEDPRGARFKSERLAICRPLPAFASVPVATNPRLSREIYDGSQSVADLAPMRTKTTLASRRDVVPVLRSMTSIASS